MSKFRITKTITQVVEIIVEAENNEEVEEKLYNGEYDDEFMYVEGEETSERDSEFEITSVEEEEE